MDFRILINFLVASALGALIGIERQRGQKRGGFAGIRTFVLLSFLGALNAFMFQEFNIPFLLPIVLFAIIGLIVASYFLSAQKGFFGMTSEISAFITFFLGFIIMFEEYRNYALVLGVAMTILLSFKNVIHKFIESAKDKEWNDTLKFALIAFVFLPLLPEKIILPFFPQGPYFDLNIFHPREVWLLIVFVSGISFVGYFVIKIIGEGIGTNLIGAMGGLVSSTAVTQSMATHSRSKVGKRFVSQKPLVISVILATIVSFMRVGFITLSINRNLISILIPVIILIVVNIIFVIVNSRQKSKIKTKVKLESPFKLKPALILGGLYAILTFFSKLSFAANLGKSGILIASIVTGFFDIDPVLLTVSGLSLEGSISVEDSMISILLAVSANQITKSIIALSTGSKIFGKCVATCLLVSICIIISWIIFIQI